ncbi:MAG TPA: hypothetical protein VHH14_04650, partial [Solirubrobacterales bacterium]|nr:hypothetical protein [Solirubrobacterales bacterium]
PRRSRPAAANPLRSAPLLALVCSVGLVLIALGNNAARTESGGAELLFWLGLALIYAPITFRLLSASASRPERLALCVLLGVGLFAIRILYSPTASSPYDEMATWRQTDDLLRSGHPFTDNPIAAGFPAFPGLELVAAALVDLTEISIFHAGLIAIGAARLILVLGLFLFLERVTGSARAAGAGIVLYVCNPSFLFFDSQFHHEPMGLGLAAAFLLVTLRWTNRGSEKDRGPLIFAVVVLAAAITLTHHMTSYAMAFFLLSWTAVAAFMERRRAVAATGEKAERSRPGWLAAARSGPALPAVVMTAMPLLWFLLVARSETTEELGGILTGSVEGVLDLFFGSDEPKALFSGSGPSNSLIAKAVALASVVALVAMIGLGIWRIWQRRRAPAIWWVLAGAAVLYPATLAVRLTQAGTETAQRASAYVFVGMAFLAAFLYGTLRWSRRRSGGSAIAAAIAGLATVIFLGGVIIGKVPATRQPGPFLVGADARSIGPRGVAAARFAEEYLERDSRIVVDRSNSTLLGSYGGLKPVQGEIDGVPVARVLFDERFEDVHRFVLAQNKIDYVAVDRRLSSGLPVLGFYFEPDEPGASTRTAPLSPAALGKFDDVPQISRVFSNGEIQIYDTRVFESG